MSEREDNATIPSKGSTSSSKSLVGEKGIGTPLHEYKPLEDDLVSLSEELLDDGNATMAGNAIVLTPNSLKIERIPFSTEEHIRGSL